MQTDNINLLNLMIGTATNISLCGIIWCLWIKKEKKRDDKETEFNKLIKEIEDLINDQDKKLIRLNKDLEFARFLSKNIDVFDRNIQKNTKDLSHYFKRLRAIESDNKETEELNNARLSWLINLISKLNVINIELHGNKGKIEINEMPRKKLIKH